MAENIVKYNIKGHNHGNHAHFSLHKMADKNDQADGESNHDSHGNCTHDSPQTNVLKQEDEGCPCCAAGIDLDEVATAISEISQNRQHAHSHNIESKLQGKLADFSSNTHWGIFLGISGPLSLIGLTAAIRNIKGTINTKEKLNKIIKGVEQDIKKYQKEGNNGVVKRLQAFKNSLAHSKFDQNFNLIVPGIINGAASTIVLSSAIWHSPWALPVIGLYSACQTGRNLYDLQTTWNRILPKQEGEDFRLTNIGIDKVNQITCSKRNFYSANALGFAIFTIGATFTFLSVIGILAPNAFFISGIVMLAVGAISTGVMNNIWTNKFKPRNGDLGVERTELDNNKILDEIALRKEMKSLIKQYRKEHLPYGITDMCKSLAYNVVTSLPFLEQKGIELGHHLNQEKLHKRHNSVGNQVSEELLSLITSLIKVKDRSFKLDENKPYLGKLIDALEKLGVADAVMDNFINNNIIHDTHNHDHHDTDMKNVSDYAKKLQKGDIFKGFTNKNDQSGEILLDLDKIEQDKRLLSGFTKAAEEYIVIDYLEKLRYQQYGLNDFFWQLEKLDSKSKVTNSNKQLADNYWQNSTQTSSNIQQLSCA